MCIEFFIVPSFLRHPKRLEPTILNLDIQALFMLLCLSSMSLGIPSLPSFLIPFINSSVSNTLGLLVCDLKALKISDLVELILSSIWCPIFIMKVRAYTLCIPLITFQSYSLCIVHPSFHNCLLFQKPSPIKVLY